MGKAFEACLKDIGVHRRFSSHGLRRTANDLIRRVSSHPAKKKGGQNLSDSAAFSVGVAGIEPATSTV
jgi:hypothetical protein